MEKEEQEVVREEICGIRVTLNYGHLESVPWFKSHWKSTLGKLSTTVNIEQTYCLMEEKECGTKTKN